MNNEQRKATRTRTHSRGNPEGLPYWAYRTYLKGKVILHSTSSGLYILFIYRPELRLALVDNLVRFPVSVYVGRRDPFEDKLVTEPAVVAALALTGPEMLPVGAAHMGANRP